MPIDGRVSSMSSNSRASICTAEVNNINNGNLTCKPTPSGRHLVVDPKELIYRDASIALLRGSGKVGAYNTSQPNPTQKQEQRTPVKSTINDAKFNLQKANGGPQKVFGCMYNLWIADRLCDVILQTSSGEIHAHKVALATYSDALAAKFSEFPQGELIHIDLSDMQQDTVHAIIKFVYTNEINISDQNVVDLMYCAAETGVHLVSAMCTSHISQGLNPQNAFQFFSTAHQRGMDDVKQKVVTYITENFKSITGRREYGATPFDILILLLYSEELGIDSELDVFLSIVRWVDHNKKDRIRLAPSLLKCVRYQLISVDQIVTQMETVDWLFRPRDCHDWLYDVLRYHALRASGSPLLASYPSQQSRRGCLSYSTTITIPGDSPFKVNEQTQQESPKAALHYLRRDRSPTEKAQGWPEPIQMHEGTPRTTDEQISKQTAPPALNKSNIHTAPDTPADTWREMNTTLTTQTAPSSQYQPVMVAVGGIDLQSIDCDVPGRYVYRYDPRANQWRVLTSMPDFLHHHGVAKLNGKLYVIGGAVYDGTQPDQLGRATNAVHVYDPSTRQWSPACPLKDSRAYHGVTAWRGKIYVIGGENQDKMKLDSIECYDVTTNSWHYVARMVGGPKIGMAVATSGDCLYIVGGYNKERSGGHVLDDVECFDLKQERWIKKQPLKVPRCHASLVEVQGRLWLVGGRARLQKGDGPVSLSSLSSVERYDSQNDVWTEVSALDHARHDASCVVLGPYIHAIGGVKTPNPHCMSSVECFNTQTGQKVEGIAALPSPAAGLACCHV